MILDGNLVKSFWLENLKEEVSKLGYSPTLTILTVGDDPASKSYVRNKVKTAEEVGITINHVSMTRDTTETDILLMINKIVTTKTDGLIVQLPICSNHPIDERNILNYIPPYLDVDCLGDTMYSNFICGDEDSVPPCTSQGVMDLLDYYEIPLEGREVVVVGRSRLVGKGLFELLLRRNATVTIAHSHSDLKQTLKNKEVVISATGIKDIINRDNIDYCCNTSFVNVGLTRDDGKLCGDIDIDAFDECSSWAGKHTPYAAGGVGPLTVINLMKNTIKLSKIGRS